MSIGHLYILFGEVSIQVLCLFFNCVVFLMSSCISSLYILEINLLSDVLLANVFSHSVGSLLMVSFAVQKFLFCSSPICLFFSFISLARVDTSAKMLQWVMSEILLPMFSSRIFMVSFLTLKSLIHFDYSYVWCKLVV